MATNKITMTVALDKNAKAISDLVECFGELYDMIPDYVMEREALCARVTEAFNSLEITVAQ